MLSIITAQAGAMRLALREAGSPRVDRLLEPGVALCSDVSLASPPVFLRHICPAEVECTLTGEAADSALLLEAAKPLLGRIPKDAPFSIQTRMIEGASFSYGRFDINTALSSWAVSCGLTLDVRRPRLIVSVTLAQGVGWIGLSTQEENLSDWAGGARRFQREPGQISRAEFKLLEALETFHIEGLEGKHALDLGAAPGGWTRVLRQKGCRVTAVDPAQLDARLLSDPMVAHYQGLAQAYFEKPAPCDIIVNDMKMDVEPSARLMVEGAACLAEDGWAIMTLKLPEDSASWASQIEQAKGILRQAYRVVAMRQLFHNRSEVTVYLTRL